MENVDVTPEQGEIISKILKNHVPQYEVWAFGSRTNGTAKKFSDLDLVIHSSKAIPLNISADLENSFTESSLPFKVDVIDWATTAPSFQKLIEDQKVVVQQPAGTQAK